MNYEDWEYHPSRLPKPYTKKRKQALESLERKFLKELKQNQKATEYLKQYNESSAAGFMAHYATWKRILVEGSEHRMKVIDKGKELRYREETEDAFDAILLKKLFNMEILWRAEQIQVPGISITMDFYRYERNVRSCPFLEPVTEREIDVMQRFLKSDHCDLSRYGGLMSWGSFYQFIEKDEEGNYEGMPEWFDYYDTYMGTAHLLLLPDIRGKKEEYYRHFHFEEAQAKRQAEEAANPRPPYVPPLPSISTFSEEERYKFSQVVDDQVFQQLFLHEWEEAEAERQAEDAAGVYDIDDIVYRLENIPDPPPVRGGVSWREALYHCWQDYLKGIICNDLPLVWEEYKFLKEAGLLPQGCKSDGDQLSDMVREQILRGRELAGEPRDFNF